MLLTTNVFAPAVAGAPTKKTKFPIILGEFLSFLLCFFWLGVFFLFLFCVEVFLWFFPVLAACVSPVLWIFFFGSRIPFVCHLSCSSSPNMVDSDG